MRKQILFKIFKIYIYIHYVQDKEIQTPYPVHDLIEHKFTEIVQKIYFKNICKQISTDLVNLNAAFNRKK